MPLTDIEPQQQEKPQFNFQNSEPLKSVPQLSTDRSARYRRPMTDEERGQSTADLIAPPKKGNILEQAVKAEGSFVKFHTEEFAGAVNTFFGTGIMDMMSGITSGKEHPASTGNKTTDLMNYVHDNAMRGLFEPNTVDITGVSLLKQYPGMNPYMAGALGALTDVGSLAVISPQSVFGKGAEFLSKESQNRLLFNKVTQSAQWGDNIMAVANHTGEHWTKVASDAQQHLWDAINKGNYFQVLKKNLELYQPFRLRGLTIEDVSGVSFPKEDPASELKPTVKAGEEVSTGKDHEEALSKVGMSKDTHVEGKDFIAGFTTKEGNFITREESMKSPYNLPTGSSSDIPEEKRKDAVQSEEFTPYELPQKVTPKKYVGMRIDYLEGQSKMIDSQMRDLEQQKSRLKKQGMTTGRIESKLDKLGKQWQYIDSQIAEHIIGQNRLSELKNDVVQGKIDTLLKYESTAEEKGFGEGFRKGVTVGKDKGKLKEAQRQSEMRTLAKYKEDIKVEVFKLSKQIKDLNTNLLPLEYKKMVEDLRDGFDLNKRTSKTLWERGQTKKYLDEAKARGETVNIPEEKLSLLEQVPLNDMTVQDLRDLHENIMSLYGMGRLKNKLKVSNEERNLEDTVKQGAEVILKGEALNPESQIIKELKKRDKGLKDMSWDKLRSYILSWRRPEALINQLDSGNPQGLNTKVLWDPINASDNHEQDLREKTDKQIAELFGFQDESRYSDKFAIQGMELTKSDLMTIYASSGNPENRAHVLAMGFKDSVFDEAERILSDQEKNAVQKYWKMQNDRFPEIYKKAYDVEGKEITQVEKRFPILDLADKSSDEMMELEYEYRRMLSKKNPTMAKNFLKERTGSELPLKNLNFFGTIYRDIDRQNHYLSFIDSVRSASKYLNHPDMRKAIIQKHGEDTYNVLQKWLKDCSMGKLPQAYGWGNEFSRFIRTRSSPAYLGYNFLTMSKQLIGIIPGMEMAGKSATVSFALTNFFRNPNKYLKFSIEKSSMMRHRAMRQEREFEEFTRNKDAFSRMKIKGYDKFLQSSLAPTLYVDRMISNCIWNAVYEKLGDLPEELRIKEADRVVRRTQPMGGIIHLPDIFRDPSEISKNMTWLKGHTNKYFNLEQDMIANKANGRDSNAKFASQFLFNTLLPMTALFYLNKKRLPKGWEWASSLGEQWFIGVWGFEELFKLMEKKEYSFSSTPFESYLKQIYDVFGAKKPSTKIEKFLNAVAVSSGFPLTGFKRILKGKPFGEADTGEEKKKKSKDLYKKPKGNINEMTDVFDKTFGYKRKKKESGIIE